MKVLIRNQQRLIRVNQQRIIQFLRKALSLLGLQKAELSVLFVNDSKMRMLNRQYRGIDRTTDVISFPQEDNFPLPFFVKGRGIAKLKRGVTSYTQDIVLGDIVINLHKARRQAIEHGVTFNEEIKRLLIHGLLHLIGYNHEKGRYDEKKMMSKEQKLLKKINKRINRKVI